ncbi:Transcription factor Sox-2 [Marasmius sp. AFHP31]|nr:Transcription factor Sox-2 [Marasmius sp. AFHP31]
MAPDRTPTRNKPSPNTSNALVPVSSASTSTSNPTTRRVGRPLNIWIYFRRGVSNMFQAFCASENLPEQKKLSGIISQIWRLFSEDEKAPFMRLARELQIVHKIRHPDYTFRPRRKTEEEKREAREKKERRELVKQAKEAECAQQKKLKKLRASQKRVVAESVPLAILPYAVGSSTATASHATSSQPMLPPSVTSSSLPWELQPATASSSNGSMHNTFRNTFNEQTQFGPRAGPGHYGQASMPRHGQQPRFDIPVSFSSNGRSIGYTPTFESGSPPSLSFSDQEGDVVSLRMANAGSPLVQQTQLGHVTQQMQATMTHTQLPLLNIPVSYPSNDGSLGHTPTSESGSPPSLSFSDSEGEVGSPMTPADADSPPFVRTATPAGWGYDTSESNMTQPVNVGDWANSTWSSCNSSTQAQAQVHDADVQQLVQFYGFQPPVDGWSQSQNQSQGSQGLFVPSEFELDNMIPDQLDVSLAQPHLPDYSHHYQTQLLPDASYLQQHDFSAFQHPENGDAQFDRTDTTVFGSNEELDVSLANVQAMLAQFTPAEIAQMLQGFSDEE